MTKDAKIALLAAWDALVTVGSSRLPPSSHHSHGGSAGCAYCGSWLSSGGHTKDPSGNVSCPIGQAQKALMPLLPNFFDREAWLADDNQPPAAYVLGDWEKPSPPLG